MKKYLILLVAAVLAISLLGCGQQAPAVESAAEAGEPQPDSTAQDAVSQLPVHSQSSAAPSGERTESSAPEQAASATESPVESQQVTSNPDTTPTIVGSSLYSTNPEDYSAMRIFGDMEDRHGLDLSIAQAGELMDGISFSGFVYTEQAYTMDDFAPHVAFMHNDLRPSLRLDKNTGIARLETAAGEMLYFVMPDGAYESIKARVDDFYTRYDTDYVPAGEADADGNINYAVG